MEVHMVAPRFHPVMGGIETHVREVGRRAVEAGFDVTVHCLRHDAELPDRDEHAGLAVRRYDPAVRLGYYTTYFRPVLPADLAAAGAVVHLHAFGHVTNDGVLRRHDPGRCLLSTHHGVRFPTPNPLGAAWHALYRGWAVPRLGRLHRVVVANATDRAALLDRGVPPGRVAVIPSGISEEAFEPPPGGGPSGGPGEAADAMPPGGFVLFLGRLHREKGVEDLVRAAVRLDPDVPVVVAGPDAGDGERLRELAARLGVQDRVHFPGRVGEEAKRVLLADAACLVLPSRHEGQGIVVLEAWAQGTPAVCAESPGVADTVEEGADGLLYEAGDVEALVRHVQALVQDPARARAMGTAGKEKAWERYRWEVLAGRVVELYEEVVSGRGRTADDAVEAPDR